MSVLFFTYIGQTKNGDGAIFNEMKNSNYQNALGPQDGLLRREVA